MPSLEGGVERDVTYIFLALANTTGDTGSPVKCQKTLGGKLLGRTVLWNREGRNLHTAHIRSCLPYAYVATCVHNAGAPALKHVHLALHLRQNATFRLHVCNVHQLIRAHRSRFAAVG